MESLNTTKHTEIIQLLIIYLNFGRDCFTIHKVIEG